jgi:hypothetical protein
VVIGLGEVPGAEREHELVLSGAHVSLLVQCEERRVAESGVATVDEVEVVPLPVDGM